MKSTFRAVSPILVALVAIGAGEATRIKLPADFTASKELSSFRVVASPHSSLVVLSKVVPSGPEVDKTLRAIVDVERGALWSDLPEVLVHPNADLDVTGSVLHCRKGDEYWTFQLVNGVVRGTLNKGPAGVPEEIVGQESSETFYTVRENVVFIWSAQGVPHIRERVVLPERALVKGVTGTEHRMVVSYEAPREIRSRVEDVDLYELTPVRKVFSSVCRGPFPLFKGGQDKPSLVGNDHFVFLNERARWSLASLQKGAVIRELTEPVGADPKGPTQLRIVSSGHPNTLLVTERSVQKGREPTYRLRAESIEHGGAPVYFDGELSTPPVFSTIGSDLAGLVMLAEVPGQKAEALLVRYHAKDGRFTSVAPAFQHTPGLTGTYKGGIVRFNVGGSEAEIWPF